MRVKLTNSDVNKVIESLNNHMNQQIMNDGNEIIKSDFIEKIL